MPEVVEHGVNGFLVPPGDVMALAHSILEFFSESENYDSMRLHAPDAVASYTEDAVFTTIEAELEKAASR